RPGGQRPGLPPAPGRAVPRAEERRGFRERRGRVGRHVALLDQRRLGRRGTAELAARAPEEYLLTLERRKRGVGIQQPGVSEPGGAPDAAVAVRREPDGRARVLERTHRDAPVAQAAVRGVVGDRLAGPEATGHRRPFAGPTDALLRVLAHRLVLDVPIAEAD